MDLGPELVVNGGFDTDTDWTKNTGWSISDGKAVFSVLNSGGDDISQHISIVNYKTYRIAFDVSDITGLQVNGSVDLFIQAGGGDGLMVTEDGHYYKDVTIDSETPENCYIYCSVTATPPYTISFKIDNVSVREVIPDGGITPDVFEDLWE